MSMISDLADRLKVESKSMGKYGVDYMATLLMQASNTIIMLSEKARADRPQGEWKPFDLTWGRSIWYCTACEESTEVPCDIWEHKPIYKYCPNCGADMRGADDE